MVWPTTDWLAGRRGLGAANEIALAWAALWPAARQMATSPARLGANQLGWPDESCLPVCNLSPRTNWNVISVWRSSKSAPISTSRPHLAPLGLVGSLYFSLFLSRSFRPLLWPTERESLGGSKPAGRKLAEGHNCRPKRTFSWHRKLATGRRSGAAAAAAAPQSSGLRAS